MPGMVPHPGHPLDHLGDARQRPQVVVEPGRDRPPVQHPPDLGQLGGAELGRLALAGGAQAVGMPVGAIAPGMRADFVVLTADPLADIKNTRTIESVWIDGKALGPGL